MARPKNNQKHFQYGSIVVKAAKFDLEAILNERLQASEFPYNQLASFFFDDLNSVANRLGIERGNQNIKALLKSYIHANAITILGERKNTKVYINPDWLFYGAKSAFTDDDKYVGYFDAKIAYANLKQDQEIAAKYSTKDEAKELEDALNRKIAKQQAMIGDITARMSSLEQTVSVIRELVETGKKPPADVTINGKYYHINTEYQVRAKAPELPAHIVDDYSDENPF
jgi:hypothetical protein